MLYLKIEGEIISYPYDISTLLSENPDVSFPSVMPKELLEDWNIFEVEETPAPIVDTYYETVIEEMPELVDNAWKQQWTIIPLTPEQINNAADIFRRKAYLEEADYLFFKWQAGESSKEDWLNKRIEIKARFPKVGQVSEN